MSNVFRVTCNVILLLVCHSSGVFTVFFSNILTLADQVADVPRVSLLGYYIRHAFKPNLSLVQIGLYEVLACSYIHRYSFFSKNHPFCGYNKNETK